MKNIKSFQDFLNESKDSISQKEASEIIQFLYDYIEIDQEELDKITNIIWDSKEKLVSHLKDKYLPKKYHKEFEKTVKNY